MANKLIAFNEVSFSYKKGEDQVINHLTFNVDKGDRLVLQGESGSGKTTVFRLLLGFEQPDDGEILFKNHPLDHKCIQQIRKKTAWLPQDLDLGFGKVKALIQFPFQFEANASSQPDNAEIVDTFERLGLQASVLEKDVNDLSTGQRQRVGTTICHLLDKPLILLDEPTSALDPTSKQKMADLLFNDSERTVLSTSHDPWWIEQCQRIIELNA